jgi:F0F1-type ATP synthase assembly protein I
MAEQDSDPHEMGRYFVLAQAGLEMVAPLAVGAVVDYFTGWGPWTTVAGAVLGFVGGTIHLILLAKHMERDESRKKKQRP